MAQSSPLIDAAKKYEQKFEDLLNKVPTPKKAPVDTSWHDKSVNDANASFVNASKSTGKRKVGGAAKDRTVAKNAAPKGGPRKRSGKQTGY
jgi:hypothetical protein